LREHSVAIPDGVGGGYVATLLPIENGRRSGILAPFAASVAVFMQDPVQVSLMPGEAFARLHGLTGGELRVLLALSQGLSGMESAEMLGISEPTVRTHLQRIFSKTGTSRQAVLLSLLHRSTPPIRAEVRRIDAVDASVRQPGHQGCASMLNSQVSRRAVPLESTCSTRPLPVPRLSV
jgi:DNA-binding CsgD family transcriptional regulator